MLLATQHSGTSKPERSFRDQDIWGSRYLEMTEMDDKREKVVPESHLGKTISHFSILDLGPGL